MYMYYASLARTSFSCLWYWHNLTVPFVRSRSRERLAGMTLRLMAGYVFWLDASDDIFVSTNPLQSHEDSLPGCFWFSIVYPVLEHFCQLPGFIARVLSINVCKSVSRNIQLDAKLSPVYFFQLVDQVFQLWNIWREEVTSLAQKRFTCFGQTINTESSIK